MLVDTRQSEFWRDKPVLLFVRACFSWNLLELHHIPGGLPHSRECSVKENQNRQRLKSFRGFSNKLNRFWLAGAVGKLARLGAEFGLQKEGACAALSLLGDLPHICQRLHKPSPRS